MWNVPAFFGVVLATVGNSNTNKLYLPPGLFVCFFHLPALYQLVRNQLIFPPTSNIFQKRFNQQELQQAGKWEQPGWEVQDAGLCSHLAWCQTGVLLGVALINSSLFFIGLFIPRSTAQMGSGLRTISYQRWEIVSSLNLPKFFCPFQLLLALFFFNDYLMIDANW